MELIQEMLTSTHLRNVLLAPCSARRGSVLASLYAELSTLQNWVHLPLEAYHPKSGNHMMTIKQDVLTTAFFHEMKTRIVIEMGILLWLQKHTASPSGKTPGFCFH